MATRDALTLLVVRGTPKALDNRVPAVWVAGQGTGRLIAPQSGAVPPSAARS